jgi:allantoin racemase
MKIRVVVPIITDRFNEAVGREAAGFAAPDTEIDVVSLDKGPASIESFYDEILAAPFITGEVQRAEQERCDGVFITCFGDPGVESSREVVDIPVVGGFQPAALTASLLSDRWSVVTVLERLGPMVRHNARKLGLIENLASVRAVDIPVLSLEDTGMLKDRLLEQAKTAVREDGAEAIVLGCTGMLGLARDLMTDLTDAGLPVPVVDPTAAAIGYLQLLIRAGLVHSKRAYPAPPKKERSF